MFESSTHGADTANQLSQFVSRTSTSCTYSCTGILSILYHIVHMYLQLYSTGVLLCIIHIYISITWCTCIVYIVYTVLQCTDLYLKVSIASYIINYKLYSLHYRIFFFIPFLIFILSVFHPSLPFSLLSPALIPCINKRLPFSTFPPLVLRHVMRVHCRDFLFYAVTLA